MPQTRNKRRLLSRLVRLREVEKRTAARQLALAQTTQQQLQSLSQRTREIATIYEERSDAMSGAELRAQGAFLAGLKRIQSETEEQRSDVLRQQSDAQRQFNTAQQKHDLTNRNFNAQLRQENEAAWQSEFAANTHLARKLKDRLQET